MSTNRHPTIFDTGAIAVYLHALRCRILKVHTGVFGKARHATVSFGPSVPHRKVPVGDLEILPLETHITPIIRTRADMPN